MTFITVKLASCDRCKSVTECDDKLGAPDYGTLMASAKGLGSGIGRAGAPVDLCPTCVTSLASWWASGVRNVGDLVQPKPVRPHSVATGQGASPYAPWPE